MIQCEEFNLKIKLVQIEIILCSWNYDYMIDNK